MTLSRRALLASGPAFLAAPALAQQTCRDSPPAPGDGPPVWRDLDQEELDAAYRQEAYQPHGDEVNRRLSALSFELRLRRGYPERAAYGEHPDEGLDIYRANATGAPVFVFVHGGIWRYIDAAMSGFAAEMFMDRGAHFVALDFSDVVALGGGPVGAGQPGAEGDRLGGAERREFRGRSGRIYVGGHSSGGHFAAVAMATDWTAFGLPADVLKSGICLSGMYDMAPVRLSWRRGYIAFTDAMEEAMSPQRHLDRITAPVVVAYGTLETPEFQRQARDFAAALEALGKPVTLVVAREHFHQDTWEALGNPYGTSGRAALAMMGL